MLIRPIQKNDNPKIAAVIREVFVGDGYPLTGTAYADPQLDAMFETYSQPQSVYFVVETDDKIVGGAGIGPVENEPTTCELQKMYFLPQARGKGLGFEMIQKCLAAATGFGYEKCYLETLSEMQVAQQLYKKAGFDYLSHPMGNTGHTTCGVWMVKDLRTPVKAFRTVFQQELAALYDADEIDSFFFLALENLHQLKRIDLALQPDWPIENSQLQSWQTILEGLKKQQPIQYLLGETEFFGLRFRVNPSVLIPRPETEQLVEWVLEESQKAQAASQKILDIGTGSGCIAVSLAKNLPGAQVVAIDVSKEALSVAATNAEINSVQVAFIEKNILDTTDLGMQFDRIVSNPPYVRQLEKAEIKPNVLENEPHLALFVEDGDALLFYRKIAQLAQKNLSANGSLYFEINQYLGKETTELLQNLGFRDIELRKDIYGNHRMIRCKR